MNLFLIFLLVAVVSIVASIVGVLWLAYPRGSLPFSKPFNRTIGRSGW